MTDLEKLLAEVTPDWCVYGEPEVGLPPSLFAGTPVEEGFGPIEPLQGYDLILAAMAPALARKVIAAERVFADLQDALKAIDGKPVHAMTGAERILMMIDRSAWEAAQ